MRAGLIVASAFVLAGAADTPAEPISAAAIRAHMEVLAADDMQGREAGTVGYLKAADYVAARYAALGLAPLGDGGGYFQNIAFIETRLAAASASLTLQRGEEARALRLGGDFVRSGGFGASEEAVTAPLVFVGFGIRAPEYDHDDFAGVDVAGKILVVLSGAPPGFVTDERAFYSSSAGKQALAAELGAVGILTVRTPVDQKRTPWSRYQARIGSSSMRWLEADGTPRGGYPELAGNAVLSESGAAQLFTLADRDLDALFARHSAGETGSFDLGVSATLGRRSEQRRVSSPNVLALLPGSDPKLRDQHVLFTAHLDHLGTRVDGAIYNGAYDNAAGVAIILEIAKAMAAGPPCRSVIFAALTAEEKGLRGSDYLAHNSPVPSDSIVANINIDMPYLGHPIADVEGLGVEHSTLQDALTAAASRVGLAVTPDPRPELVRFIRSDQFSFVKQGIPGLNLKAGSQSSDPEVDGTALRSAFLRAHYHRPSDDLSLPFSEVGARRLAQVALTFGQIVANDDEPPRWKEGDFFGDRFGRAAVR
ncbi:MAG: M28 family metallopeptidase [Sphingomonadales bacterium]|nr:M28 family metallopeptidase [Sphingomonadales bacterium]